MRDAQTCFFPLIECVVNVRGWPEADHVLILQTVLTGKAQEAYSALGEADRQKYSTDKRF